MKQQQESVAENNETNVPGQTPEPAAEENTQTAAPAEESAPEAGNDQITELTNKVATYTDRLLRLQADFDNFRKRQIRERADIIKRANEDFALDILCVLDHFDHAFNAFPKDQQNDENPFYKGFHLVLQSLLSSLAKHGVTPLPDPVGKPLDPNSCEAISVMATGASAPGNVLYVARKGYALNDRVLRATQVVVEQEAESAEPEPAAETQAEENSSPENAEASGDTSSEEA